jgi:hypothetical protein
MHYVQAEVARMVDVELQGCAVVLLSMLQNPLLATAYKFEGLGLELTRRRCEFPSALLALVQWCHVQIH